MYDKREWATEKTWVGNSLNEKFRVEFIVGETCGTEMKCDTDVVQGKTKCSSIGKTTNMNSEEIPKDTNPYWIMYEDSSNKVEKGTNWK